MGKSLGEANLRKETGASVVAVIRDEAMEANPDAAYRLAAGDLVAIIGTEKQHMAFHLKAGMQVPLGGPRPLGCEDEG